MKKVDTYGLQEQFLQIMRELCVIPDNVYLIIPVPWFLYRNKR